MPRAAGITIADPDAFIWTTPAIYPHYFALPGGWMVDGATVPAQ